MSYYPRLTPNQIKFIQTEIEQQTWNNTLLRNFFEVNGLIRNIPEGMLTYETTLWEKLAPGQIGADIYDLPDSVPGFKVQTAKIMTLGTKIILKMGDVDKWRNNPLGIGGGDMMGQAVNQQMRALYQQVDQFLARGDDMKSPVLGDFMAGAGLFTGLFNGGTAFGAGLGGDNNVNAAGDYLGSIPTAKKALMVGISAVRKAVLRARSYAILFCSSDFKRSAARLTQFMALAKIMPARGIRYRGMYQGCRSSTPWETISRVSTPPLKMESRA